MARFTYRARNRAGERVQGLMLAENEDQLALTLREMDLYLVHAKPVRVSQPIYITAPVKRREIIDFTVHLAAAIGAGIPILDAFEDLEQQTSNSRFKEAIRAITGDLKGGSSLSAALSHHPHIFSELYVSVIRAGEASGGLVGVLQRMISFLEWQENLASEIKRATIYPSVVLFAVLCLLGVLLGFVFPRIIPVIQALKVPLPFLTLAVMAVADFVRFSWYWILLGMAVLYVLVRLLKRNEGGRLIIDALKLKIPIIGTLVEKICMSRFAHHLGTLLATGIDIRQTLTIAEEVVGNAVIAQAVRETREKVIQGGPLWRSLQETGAFPPLVVRMIFVGETTGNMDNTMERVTEYYDRDIPATVKKIFAVMEPLVIIVLAVIVLLVALSIFIPLYGALGRVGKS